MLGYKQPLSCGCKKEKNLPFRAELIWVLGVLCPRYFRQYHLYECKLFFRKYLRTSHTCLQSAAPLQLQNLQQQRPCRPQKKKRHKYSYTCAHSTTWFTEKLCRRQDILAGRPGHVVQYRAGCCAVMPLIQNETDGCVHIRTQQAHNTPCICQEMKQL